MKAWTYFYITTLVLLTSCSSHSYNTDKLVLIAAEGTPEELRSVLERAKIDDVSTIRFDQHRSLSHAAIANINHPDVIYVLRDFGEDIDSKDANERTPLDYAMNNNASEAARILLELGADFKSPRSNGSSIVDSCRKVVLRDEPTHRTCNIIVGFDNKE